jgi:hypothetical protein
LEEKEKLVLTILFIQPKEGRASGGLLFMI